MINITAVSLIQELRAIHALSEIPVKINIDPSDEPKFEYLKQNFRMNYSCLKDDHNPIDISEILQVDHSKPTTSILSVEKPLIFPKAITTYLKNNWPHKRKYQFSFTGFLTPEREKVIEKWLFSVSGKEYHLKTEPLIYRLKRKLYLNLKPPRPIFKKIFNLYISSSNKGRVFPVKSWDDSYYTLLLNSQFVLCPSGVHVWTYRFFESILCGAIPIVEQHSPCYKDFKYYTMNENLNNIKWSLEIANYNYNLCLERITLSQIDVQNISEDIKAFNKKPI